MAISNKMLISLSTNTTGTPSIISFAYSLYIPTGRNNVRYDLKNYWHAFYRKNHAGQNHGRHHQYHTGCQHCRHLCTCH